ncbi:MAG: hypothetical protein AMJ62_07250 [Myxococcales bacterium SG8_38]|nr:MAG: hypothetical protein AMJ62_07250 [Myxococcales bacterium SG8_38]
MGRSFFLCLALVAVVGCGDDSGAEAPPAVVRTDLPYELYCDIARSDCQGTIYDSVAAMLGAEDVPRPFIRTISVEEHEQEVRRSLNLEDLTGEDAASRGLRLLGFIPEQSDSLAAAQAEYFITQIAAYYSRNSRSITVIDRDYDEINAQTLLAHELVHAIQDNQFGLNAVTASADTEDGVIAVRSVIEGDAMHSSFAWAYDKLGYPPDEIDWEEMHQERTRAEREVAADTGIALIDSASGFPYSYGFRFMTSATLSGGLAGRAAAFESPPAASLEVMAGYDAAAPALDFPAAAHPAPVGGYALDVENRFGAWYVYGFLRRRGLSDEVAWPVALGWRGDVLAIYENGADVVAVWRVQLDHPLSALLLENEVNGDVSPGAWSAIAVEDEVFVLAAESGESLLAWAEQPLDTMTASILPKSARRWGGPVSPGNCLQSKTFSLQWPATLLQ